MTEREKMLLGELYRSTDLELLALLARATVAPIAECNVE